MVLEQNTPLLTHLRNQSFEKFKLELIQNMAFLPRNQEEQLYMIFGYKHGLFKKKIGIIYSSEKKTINLLSGVVEPFEKKMFYKLAPLIEKHIHDFYNQDKVQRLQYLMNPVSYPEMVWEKEEMEILKMKRKEELNIWNGLKYGKNTTFILLGLAVIIGLLFPEFPSISFIIGNIGGNIIFTSFYQYAFRKSYRYLQTK